MKFTLSWLKDHLDTQATPHEISERLISLGLEIEHIEDLSVSLEGFTVAHIMATQPHPQADRLKICEVDTGKHHIKVVCGAPNARAGLKVILAVPGVKIPATQQVLKPAVIRGVASEGMLCSLEELGLAHLASDTDGIYEADPSLEIGLRAAKVFGLDDVLFDIAVTPNRGDCLNVFGIARDLAASGIGSLKSQRHENKL